MQLNIIGAGLAGCEAALWLADRGVQVELYEQKPTKYSPAHKSAGFAELICSNSLKAERPDSASGLLKIEMKLLGSHLLDAAETARVAAGGALAVDRDVFSSAVLVTDSLPLAQAVQREVEVQLERLPRREIARRSVEENGKILLTRSLDAAVDAANRRHSEREWIRQAVAAEQERLSAEAAPL